MDEASVIRSRNEGKTEEAMERLQDALAKESGNSELHYLYAKLLVEKGRMEPAVAELLATIQLNPNHSNAYNDLGCIYAGRQAYEQAYENLGKAVITDRFNYGALKNLMILLLHLKCKGQCSDPVAVVSSLFPHGIRDIGVKQMQKNAPRALIIYVETSIPWYLAGMLHDFPRLNEHSMYWEAAEMVRLLNEQGYVVDYLANWENVSQNIDYKNYALVIDGACDNLSKLPPLEGQTRVFYSTGKHWLVANIAGLQRNWMFYQRHGIIMPAERQQDSNFDDQQADYLTYFGNEHQLDGFSPRVKKIPLDISAVHVPVPRERNIATAKSHFIWLGGHAMIHKGLDLAVEAFKNVPEATLHIAAHLEIEPQFLSWFRSFTELCPNIVYHGGANVSSPEFEQLAWQCLGTVYVSAAEGGPGSIAQLLHFGIIPIVSRSSNVRAEGLCCVIDHEKDVEIIEAIQKYVREIMATPEEVLRERSRRIMDFALEYHTREAYSRSLKKLIALITAEERLSGAVRA